MQTMVSEDARKMVEYVPIDLENKFDEKICYMFSRSGSSVCIRYAESSDFMNAKKFWTSWAYTVDFFHCE